MTPNGGIVPITVKPQKEERSESHSSAGAAIDKTWLKAKDQDSYDLDIQKGKLLIKHLMKIYDKSLSDQDSLEEQEDSQFYKDVLFNMLIPSKEFSEVECMNDFVELVQVNIMKIIDLEKSMPGKNSIKKKVYEILFVEKA